MEDYVSYDYNTIPDSQKNRTPRAVTISGQSSVLQTLSGVRTKPKGKANTKDCIFELWNEEVYCYKDIGKQNNHTKGRKIKIKLGKVSLKTTQTRLVQELFRKKYTATKEGLK